MLNCLFFRIFSSVRMKWVWASARYLAFGRTPGHRRLAKCDAGSFVGTSSISFTSARARKLIHSAAPPLKIAIALLDCDFVLCTSVQRGLFLPRRTHTRCRGRKPHTAATRGSRCGTGSLPADRVDRDDFFHGGKIGTIDPFQADQPLSVTLSERYENAVFP